MNSKPLWEASIGPAWNVSRIHIIFEGQPYGSTSYTLPNLEIRGHARFMLFCGEGRYGKEAHLTREQSLFLDSLRGLAGDDVAGVSQEQYNGLLEIMRGYEEDAAAVEETASLSRTLCSVAQELMDKISPKVV